MTPAATPQAPCPVRATSPQTTRYGFDWGPAQILRYSEHKGHIVLAIKTSRQELVVRVTPSGLIRPDEPVKRLARQSARQDAVS